MRRPCGQPVQQGPVTRKRPSPDGVADPSPRRHGSPTRCGGDNTFAGGRARHLRREMGLRVASIARSRPARRGAGVAGTQHIRAARPRRDNGRILSRTDPLEPIGAAGFEPATSCSQSRRDTWLRYAPSASTYPRRPCWCNGSRGIRRSASRSAAKARARWLTLDLASVVASAKVTPSSWERTCGS